MNTSFAETALPANVYDQILSTPHTAPLRIRSGNLSADDP
jgi:hypothetical protein